MKFDTLSFQFVDDSGVCCCDCVTSFERYLTPLYIDSFSLWRRFVGERADEADECVKWV